MKLSEETIKQIEQSLGDGKDCDVRYDGRIVTVTSYSGGIRLEFPFPIKFEKGSELRLSKGVQSRQAGDVVQMDRVDLLSQFVDEDTWIVGIKGIKGVE